MKAPILETADPDIHLIEPDIERDAQLGVAWLNGQVGRKTLELMGVPDKDNKPSSLENERGRVRDFIDREDQLNWMIEANNNVVGSIWVNLESTNEVPGPAVHIMIGNPEARGRGIGDTVTKAVINYLREQGNSKIYSRRLISNDNAAKLLSQNGFVELDSPYTDRDGLTWQNVVLDMQP
jgi:ribosomal protein S18 acetylase RimI-like enzyme